MNDSMTVMAMAHLYGGEGVIPHTFGEGTPWLSVAVGHDLHLLFHTPEAFSGFLLAIASSEDAQQYLAQAGAGFSMTVEPLPVPANA